MMSAFDPMTAIGRKLPLKLSILVEIERPLSVKAAVRHAPPISAQLAVFLRLN
jgi:hypothetical protein